MGSAPNDSINVGIKNEVNLEKTVDEDVGDLEWSADQEILLLYSLHECKPVGPNKHFRMLTIQERFSSAMNKDIPSKLIWKKLNTLYDLEALDEAEAEADAAVAVDTDFFLPKEEYGELMAKKLKEPNVEVVETENSDSQGGETLMEIKLELEEGEDNEEETEGGDARGKEGKKEAKRGSKKKDVAVAKDSTPVKKDSKETPKKETPTKKDIGKEAKKGVVKDNEKKNAQEIKKETAKEQKEAAKPSKKESADKKLFDQTQKEAVIKKADQKKVVEMPKNQREGIRPRAETPKLRVETKKVDAKVTRMETPKPQRVEALKKDLSAEKKKDKSEKKAERKSPEKTPESTRSAKLRARDKTEPDKTDTPTGSKRERSRDSTSKASDASSEEHPLRKLKTPVTKGRPTRNSLEQSATPTTASSPQKRKTRLL